MRFCLDENFPATAGRLLQSLGHEVFRTLDFHSAGTMDEILFVHAQELEAVFLTTDKDFFHTIPFF